METSASFDAAGGARVATRGRERSDSQAALEYYGPIVRKRVDPHLWPVVRGWKGRVDNWAHADGLAGLYSRILERRPDEVHPQLEVWNRSQGEWLPRISLVSLIHYTGGNAVFLPPGKVLPFVTACLADERHYVPTAVGWVLREMGRAYPERIKSYVEANAERLRPAALARATERWSAPKEPSGPSRSGRRVALALGAQNGPAELGPFLGPFLRACALALFSRRWR